MHEARRRYTDLIVIGPLRPGFREIFSRATANVNRQSRFFGQRIFWADGLNRLDFSERSIQAVLGKPNCQHYFARGATRSPCSILIVPADGLGQTEVPTEEI